MRAAKVPSIGCSFALGLQHPGSSVQTIALHTYSRKCQPRTIQMPGFGLLMVSSVDPWHNALLDAAKLSQAILQCGKYQGSFSSCVIQHNFKRPMLQGKWRARLQKIVNEICKVRITATVTEYCELSNWTPLHVLPSPPISALEQRMNCGFLSLQG